MLVALKIHLYIFSLSMHQRPYVRTGPWNRDPGWRWAITRGRQGLLYGVVVVGGDPVPSCLAGLHGCPLGGERRADTLKRRSQDSTALHLPHLLRETTERTCALQGHTPADRLPADPGRNHFRAILWPRPRSAGSASVGVAGWFPAALSQDDGVRAHVHGKLCERATAGRRGTLWPALSPGVAEGPSARPLSTSTPSCVFPPFALHTRCVPLINMPFPPNDSVLRKTDTETCMVAFPLNAFIFQNILQEGRIFPFPPRFLCRKGLVFPWSLLDETRIQEVTV